MSEEEISLAIVKVPGHWRVRKGHREWVDSYQYDRRSLNKERFEELQGLDQESAYEAVAEVEESQLMEDLSGDFYNFRQIELPEAISEFKGQERINPKAQKEILDRAQELYQDYGIKVRLDASASNPAEEDSGAYARTEFDVDNPLVWFNAHVINSPKMNALISNQKSIMVSQSIGDVYEHEFGHILHQRLEARDRNAYGRLSSTLEEPKWSYNVYGDYSGVAGTREKVVNSFLGLSVYVSAYAAANVLEGMAEVFLSYRKNGANNYWTKLAKKYFDGNKDLLRDRADVALTRVVVPPHERIKNGKRQEVDGYTYERRGGKNKINIDVDEVEKTRIEKIEEKYYDLEDLKRDRQIQEIKQKLEDARTKEYDFPKEPLPEAVDRWIGQHRINPQTQKDILERAQKLYEEWNIKVALDSTRGNPSEEMLGVWAETDTSDPERPFIYLNAGAFNTPEMVQFMASSTENSAKEPADVYTHEFGHVLHLRAENRDLNAFKELLQPFAVAVNPQWNAMIEMSGQQEVVSQLGIVHFLSAYAAANPFEGMAEAFTKWQVEGDLGEEENFWTHHAAVHFENLKAKLRDDNDSWFDDEADLRELQEVFGFACQVCESEILNLSEEPFGDTEIMCDDCYNKKIQEMRNL